MASESKLCGARAVRLSVGEPTTLAEIRTAAVRLLNACRALVS